MPAPTCPSPSRSTRPSVRRPLYEYRPLVRGFVEERAHLLRALTDAKLAVEDLRARAVRGDLRPRARRSRADRGARRSSARCCCRSSSRPPRPAEASTGTTTPSTGPTRELEASLFGEAPRLRGGRPARRRLRARAGRPRRRRPRAPHGRRRALAALAGGARPAAARVRPRARPPLRARAPRRPRPGRAAAAGRARRARRRRHRAPSRDRRRRSPPGPVLFERLDFRPLGIRPLLPIAGTQPAGEPTRLDAFRAGLAVDLRDAARASPTTTASSADALDRWELSLFAEEPFRTGQLTRGARVRCSAPATASGRRRVRAALLLGETREGARRAARGACASDRAPDHVRRALVETLMHGERAALVTALDEALLGLGPRPASVYAKAA